MMGVSRAKQTKQTAIKTKSGPGAALQGTGVASRPGSGVGVAQDPQMAAAAHLDGRTVALASALIAGGRSTGRSRRAP